MLRFPESSTYNWAIEFDEQSKVLIEKGDHQSLIEYQKLGRAAKLSTLRPTTINPYSMGWGFSGLRTTLSFRLMALLIGKLEQSRKLYTSSHPGKQINFASVPTNE